MSRFGFHSAVIVLAIILSSATVAQRETILLDFRYNNTSDRTVVIPGALLNKNTLSAATSTRAMADVAFSSSITAFAAGWLHTCALTTTSGVKCWGGNDYGQLGDGTTTDHFMPMDVSGLVNGVTAIAAGYQHTCALTSGGGVKCWGHNDTGQLGDGSKTDRLAPVDVIGLTSGVTAITAGTSHTCALTTLGGVKCWGNNFDGQLGDGTGTNHLTPVDVYGLASDVRAIAAGWGFTCALTSGGDVKCWGYLVDGPHLTPVEIVGLTTGVTTIAAGGIHACALTTTGGVKCWGGNAYGALGDGTTTNRLGAVDVNGLTSGIIAIAAGSVHTCALTSTGGIKCWGNNAYGQLGDGTTTTRLTPVDVNSLTSGVTAIADGELHTCIAMSAGGAKCWGSNFAGQLGDGTASYSPTPVSVIGLTSDVTAITTGWQHACALTTMSGIKCWGDNSNGELGDGTTTNRLTAVDVIGLPTGVTAIGAGGWHTCALTAAGGIKCWGDNSNGELGDGTTTNRLTPVDVSGLPSGVTAIAAGVNHTCALITTGGIKCWGDNYYGELGDGTTTNRLAPVDVSGLTSGVTAIAAGWGFTCALTTTGRIKCWGENNSGGLGDGTTINRLTPVYVTGLTSSVAAIAAGNGYTCALTTTGGIKCWGYNGGGQLGDGTQTNRLTPVDVTGLPSGVTAIAAGGDHTCALTATSGIKCWGDNSNGELGDGTTTTRLTPVDVSGLTSGVTKIAAGFSHTCALTATGWIKCWGSNGNGQLGDGVPLYRTTPIDVAVFTPITVSHIEVSQAIQDSTNSVPLIASKPTFARMYVNCTEQCANVTGILRGYGPSGELPGSPRQPVNISINAEYAPDWTVQSGSLTETLNFTVPPQWTVGTITLTAQVAGIQSSVTSTFQSAKALYIVYVPVRDKGLEPNHSNIDRAASFAGKLYPTNQLYYIPYPTWDWHRSVWCWRVTQWDKDCLEADLKTKLTDLFRPLGLTGTSYIFGWLPNSSRPDFGGLQGTSDPTWAERGPKLGRAAFGIDISDGNPRTLVHEVGHLLGRHHTNTTANDNDTANCYPDRVDGNSDWVQHGYQDSKIHEWGVDGYGFGWLVGSSSALKNPGATYDYMSYCGQSGGILVTDNAWTSDWTYTHIFSDELQLTGATSIQVPAAPQFYFLASGLIYTDTVAFINPIWIITSTIVPDNPPLGSQYCFETQDAMGTTLARRCFDMTFVNYETGASTGVTGFSIALPYTGGVSRFVLKSGSQELTAKQVSTHAPAVNVLSPQSVDSWLPTGVYTITWSGIDVDGDSLDYKILYSPDEKNWIPVGSDITETQLIINAAELAGSNSARIRVMASDGTNTTVVDSPAFNVGRKPPQVFILAPETNGSILPNTPLLLQGYAYDLEDGMLWEGALQWSSNHDGNLGTGTVDLTILSPGQHIITLTATDSDGNISTSSVSIFAGANVYLPLIRRNY